MSRKIKVLAPVILVLGVLAGLVGLAPAGLGTGVAQANPGWCNSWRGNDCNDGWNGWRGDRGRHDDCWDRCDWRPAKPAGNWNWDGNDWVPPYPPAHAGWNELWRWDGWNWCFDGYR